MDLESRSDGLIANYVNPSGYNPRTSRGKSGEIKEGVRPILLRVNLAHPFVSPGMHTYSTLITNRSRSPLGRATA